MSLQRRAQLLWGLTSGQSPSTTAEICSSAAWWQGGARSEAKTGRQEDFMAPWSMLRDGEKCLRRLTGVCVCKYSSLIGGVLTSAMYEIGSWVSRDTVSMGWRILQPSRHVLPVLLYVYGIELRHLGSLIFFFQINRRTGRGDPVHACS
jgi:hypothetical protein